MIEEEVYIKAYDCKDIYVRCCLGGNNNKAVILAHGITGRADEYIHMTARFYFLERGYDVYVISFYDDSDNARKMHTTTLPIQAEDIASLIEHVGDKYEKTFICGHSYGGATLLFANPQTTAIAFWDPSYFVWQYWEQFTQDDSSLENIVISTSSRINMLHNFAMREHALSQTEESMKALANSIEKPSIVITAEHGGLIRDVNTLYRNLNCEKEYAEIKGADHCFINGKTVFDLFDKTEKWFSKF